ncbi:MAG: hypothetical protein LBU51_06585 [Bacteroidales bacterium]|nr:hypothetical protein [Bacteroidales bacterium]
MANKFNVTKRTIERHCNKLKIEGKIVREGGRKSGKWVIIK